MRFLCTISFDKSGHCITAVRARRGKVSVTDGPFAETNEQIGGFFVIDAPDLREATRLASTIPTQEGYVGS
jgi:hypothetical protein